MMLDDLMSEQNKYNWHHWQKEKARCVMTAGICSISISKGIRAAGLLSENYLSSMSPVMG